MAKKSTAVVTQGAQVAAICHGCGWHSSQDPDVVALGQTHHDDTGHKVEAEVRISTYHTWG